MTYSRFAADHSLPTDSIMTPPLAPESRSSLLRWLPFDAITAGVSWLRRLAFSKERPGGPALRVSASPPELREVFGRQHFVPNWQLSYYYYGETLNLRRVAATDPAGRDTVYRTPDGEPIDWWQVHVRGFTGPLATADGSRVGPDDVALMAHVEPEPAAHPAAHTDGVGLVSAPGRRIVAMVLRRAGYEPDTVTLADPTANDAADSTARRLPQSH